jgi:vacuolar-type H+-ATPase subunit I/STV1
VISLPPDTSITEEENTNITGARTSSYLTAPLIEKRGLLCYVIFINIQTVLSEVDKTTLKGVFSMPRPKGSKNRVKKAETVNKVQAPEEIGKKIDEITAEIDKLGEEIKSKKAELKSLMKVKADMEKAAAEKKAEENKAKILAAVEASGKSVDEILEMLK